MRSLNVSQSRGSFPELANDLGTEQMQLWIHLSTNHEFKAKICILQPQVNQAPCQRREDISLHLERVTFVLPVAYSMTNTQCLLEDMEPFICFVLIEEERQAGQQHLQHATLRTDINPHDNK